jgi:hypothetical protein
MPVKQLLGDRFQLGEQVMVGMAIGLAGLLWWIGGSGSG